MCTGQPVKRTGENASGLHGPSLDREHGCLHRGGRQADQKHLGQMKTDRIEIIKYEAVPGSAEVSRCDSHDRPSVNFYWGTYRAASSGRDAGS